MDWREFLEKRDDWDKQEKDNDKKSKINRTGKIGKKDAKDIVRRTYNGKTPNKFMQQVNSNMAADEEKHSGNRPRGDKRVPLSRVRTHTNEPLRYGGVAEDTPIGASHQSDHQLRTGRKEQYIEPENADLWKSWLEKGSLDGKQSAGGLPKGSKYSGLTPKQRKIQESINNEKDSDNQYYKNSSWESWLEKNDPCWEGYEQYGMKDKDGKKVPNCVKKADESKPLNKPMRDDGSKKFKVFVRDPSTGNIITVRFGDPNMEIKRDNPERRSSFRARHKCSEQKDITSAAYWSCKMWEKTSSVSDNVNKSNWELWLEKNNATETSHKEGEKKEEWNGKFDNSTTRDDAKDEKAESEEESLEELTDGKLEEVEKLKAWEVFLEKNQYPQDNIPEKKDEDGDSEINYETGTKLQESKETGQATLTDDKHRDMENEDTSNNLTQRFRRGNLRGQAQGAGRKGYNNAGASGGVPKGWAGKYGKGGKSFGADQWGGTMSGDSARPNADGTRTTLDGLRQQIQRINEHENKKELSSTGQPATAQQKEVADIESVGKSWELFLEKGITYKEQNVGVHKEQPYAKARTAKEIREAAENVKTEIVLDEDMKKKKSWNEWLEKMQGAGDARFGNQHLTGMEQKPVADDESIELSAESDKNNEKQEKTEDKEDKDNKPYKALSQE